MLNKRADELMVEAATYALINHTDNNIEDVLRRKLIELVVRECSDLTNNDADKQNILNHFGVDNE